jgi:hypothetical protein
VLLQAAGLALLAAISPTALLIVAIYLGSAQPRRTAAFYLTGAIIVSVIMGAVLLVVLRSTNLSHSSEHGPRYGFRLGLGILLLGAAWLVSRRKPRTTDPSGAQQGLVYRMAGNPSPWSALAVGILVFAPGASFLAALQVIATARASVQLTVAAVIVVVVIYVMFVWLPIVLYVLAPEATGDFLRTFNGWLRAHGRALLVWVLVAVGGIMIGNGIYGLVGG